MSGEFGVRGFALSHDPGYCPRPPDCMLGVHQPSPPPLLLPRPLIGTTHRPGQWLICIQNTDLGRWREHNACAASIHILWFARQSSSAAVLPRSVLLVLGGWTIQVSRSCFIVSRKLLGWCFSQATVSASPFPPSLTLRKEAIMTHKPTPPKQIETFCYYSLPLHELSGPHRFQNNILMRFLEHPVFPRKPFWNSESPLEFSNIKYYLCESRTFLTLPLIMIFWQASLNASFHQTHWRHLSTIFAFSVACR